VDKGSAVPGRTARLQPGSLVYTGITVSLDRRMEFAGAPGGDLVIQHLPGRRIHLSRYLATQDEGRLWKMGLGRERRPLRVVSSSPAMGLAREYPVRFVIRLHR